jgi:translation initiation factor IF-1
MGNPNQIPARGTVVEILNDGAYRIELANGHRAIVRAVEGAALLSVGDKIPVEFHPFDLSRGRVVVRD